jgi:hypothetical protein
MSVVQVGDIFKYRDKNYMIINLPFGKAAINYCGDFLEDLKIKKVISNKTKFKIVNKEIQVLYNLKDIYKSFPPLSDVSVDTVKLGDILLHEGFSTRLITKREHDYKKKVVAISFQGDIRYGRSEKLKEINPEEYKINSYDVSYKYMTNINLL